MATSSKVWKGCARKLDDDGGRNPKGAVDGAVVKRYVWSEVRAKKAIVRNAADFTKLIYGKTKVNIIHVLDEDIEKAKEHVLPQWEKVKSVKGTQKIHFIAARHNAICYKPYPQHHSFTKYVFDTENIDGASDITDDDNETLLCSGAKNGNLQCGQWVTVIYDGARFHSLITAIINEDYQIKCLVPTKIKGVFKFEPDEHSIWHKKDEIMANVDAPTLINSRGFYKI